MSRKATLSWSGFAGDGPASSRWEFASVRARIAEAWSGGRHRRRSSGPPNASRPAVGPAWGALIDEFESRLVDGTASATLVRAYVDSYGLLRFEVRAGASTRRDVQRMRAEFEHRAVSSCESCGAPSRVFAGAVVRILCADCGT